MVHDIVLLEHISLFTISFGCCCCFGLPFMLYVGLVFNLHDKQHNLPYKMHLIEYLFIIYIFFFIFNVVYLEHDTSTQGRVAVAAAARQSGKQNRQTTKIQGMDRHDITPFAEHVCLPILCIKNCLQPVCQPTNQPAISLMASSFFDNIRFFLIVFVVMYCHGPWSLF